MIINISKRTYLFLSFICLAILTWPISLSSAQENVKKQYVFIANNDFAPYSFIKDTQQEGYFVDIVNNLRKTAGLDISLELAPWEECLARIKSGKADGVIGVTKTPEMSKYVNFSDSIREYEYAIFVTLENSHIVSLSSLEGTVVAIPKANLIISDIRKNEKITVEEVNNIDEAFEMLKTRKAAAVITEQNEGLFYLKKGVLAGKIILTPLIEISHPFYIGVIKENTEVLEKINTGLDMLNMDGTNQESSIRWFSSYMTEPFPWKLVLFTIAGISVIIIGISGLLWTLSLRATVQAKTRELEILSSQMVAKEKLAVLGTLAGQIAHEIRTPLGIMKNSVYLLRHESPDDRATFEKRLSMLEEKITLTSEILESILGFSKLEAKVPADISVTECLDKVIKDVNMPSTIQLEISIPEKMPSIIFMDFHQLYTVLRNLILNAVQSMEENGKLTIRMEVLRQANQLNVHICDTGGGIMESVRHKIFNLFYSSKITGTGLGLPISKSIAEANGGDLKLEESSEKGTCFVLTLPLAAANVKRRKK